MKMQTFTQQPMHHFTLKMAGHPKGIAVQTDFKLTRGTSKAYREDLQAHVTRCEADAAKPPKKKHAFVESARGKRRR